VVAGEVRSLAQRSAEAAKEIKSLINDSVERVKQGTALFDQAGSTMSEVVAAVKRITNIVAESSCASVEQSSGVAPKRSARAAANAFRFPVLSTSASRVKEALLKSNATGPRPGESAGMEERLGKDHRLNQGATVAAAQID
jgi:hypothetical protein